MFKPSEDLKARYTSLSQWIDWSPRVLLLIQESKLPPVMKGELEAALTIHGDNLLDLYRDSLQEELAAYYAGPTPSEDDHEWADEFLMEMTSLAQDVKGSDDPEHPSRVEFQKHFKAIVAAINPRTLREEWGKLQG